MSEAHDDPLADSALAELAATRLVRAADHPWELEQPADFDPLDAVERFLKLAREVEGIVGEVCEVDAWPHVRAATFHGEIVLPASAVAGEGSAVIRASNFANLLAVLNDDALVKPEVFAPLRRRFDRGGYRFIPSALLRRTYDGHHRGTKHFATWTDRLFGYL